MTLRDLFERAAAIWHSAWGEIGSSLGKSPLDWPIWLAVCVGLVIFFVWQVVAAAVEDLGKHPDAMNLPWTLAYLVGTLLVGLGTYEFIWGYSISDQSSVWLLTLLRLIGITATTVFAASFLRCIIYQVGKRR